LEQNEILYGAIKD
jgi:hypothetical protein